MRMLSFNRRYVAGPESNLRNQQNGHCAQRKHRSTCASAQSDQSLRCPLEETLGPQLLIERTTKTLIRLGGSESSLRTIAFLLVLL